MVGIVSYGAYIPIYRLKRSDIAQAWGQALAPGEKAVASWDEDSLTMATEAAIDCLKGVNSKTIDSLIFATTTSPFREKQAAALIATAVGLRPDILTMDCTGSLRSGAIAIRCGMDCIKAGSAKRVLVVAADCRLGAPGTALEQDLGDGAAALLLGDSEVAVSIEGNYSCFNEFTDFWRRDSDKFVRSWEDRFIQTHGYQRIITGAISEVMKRYNLTPKDFAKVALYGSNARTQAAAAGAAGFDARTQLQGLLFNEVGNSGAAFPLMLSVAALEQSKPEDRILVAAYGDGADIFILRVIGKIAEVKGKKGISGYLPSKKMLTNYQKYVTFREIMPTELGRQPAISVPSTLVWRELNSLVKFHGSKCRKCGEVQFPIQRICQKCHSKDEFDEISLIDSKGKVFHATLDTLGFTANEPPPLWAIVDFDKGARARLAVADAELEEVKTGADIEPTFRKFPRQGDVPTYAWKCRLVR